MDYSLGLRVVPVNDYKVYLPKKLYGRFVCNQLAFILVIIFI
jgi:hypothetical protein